MKIQSLRNSYPRFSDLEICQRIALGTIAGAWISEQDKKLTINANPETAKDIIDEIDRNRQYSYNYWNMFN